MRNLANATRTFTVDVLEAKSAFVAAMQKRSLELSDGLMADGHFHRCNASNKRGWHGKNDGAYVFHLDGGIPRGGFCNYTDGHGWQGWVYKTSRHLTDEERHKLERESEQARAKIAKLRERAYQHAQRRALRRWENAGRASNRHPYLTSKQVISYGLRQDGERRRMC
jgi:phage/plasmid primase-like uncharacterized protein